MKIIIKQGGKLLPVRCLLHPEIVIEGGGNCHKCRDEKLGRILKKRSIKNLVVKTYKKVLRIFV